MKIQSLVVVTLSCCVLAHAACTKNSTLSLLKRPTYEFSVRLLQRVAEDTEAHFVFSPMTTWLQLTALAEGATGYTLREIWQVTQFPRHTCFRKRLGSIISNLNRALKNESKRTSVIAIDNLMAVKKKFIKKVDWLYGIKVLLLDFNDPIKAAKEVNNAVEHGTGGNINQILYYEDFNSTVLLMSDANYFRCDWKTSFQSGYTKVEKFYGSSGGVIGNVSMMHQKGYYHMHEFPFLRSKVLQLPCANNRVSMLVFLPTSEMWIGEIFYSLQRTRLAAIFNMFKHKGKKLVDVAIPKFELHTELDNLPELLYDMDIKKMFNPNLGQFKGISKYRMYASLMTQKSFVKVDETGVSGGVEFLAINDTSEDFSANQPFAFMIVDRITEFILYAGVYSIPNAD